MAITNDKDLLRIGRGKLFIKRIDDSTGLDQGEGFVFGHQVTSVAYTPNEEKLEEQDATSAVGGVLAEITVARKPTIKCTFKAFDADLLATALMGELATYTQAATPVAAEAKLNVKQGTYVSLEKMGPVTAVGIEPLGGGTPYTVTDDYVIEDGKYPMIYIVPDGAITTGSDIEIDYTPTAYTLVQQIKGATKSEIECALRFISSSSHGPTYNFDAWKCSVNIDAVLEFIQSATEFGSFDVTFTLLDDSANHATTPYIDLRRMDNTTTT